VSKDREKKEMVIVTSIFIVVFVGIAVLSRTFASPHMSSPIYEKTISNEAGIYLADDYKHGTNPNASVHVIMFGDYQCPYTVQAMPGINQLLEAYGNNINFVYKHMPNFKIHKQAVLASLASECAREQGMFWEYSQQLFNKSSILSYDVMIEGAYNVGVEMQQFEECISLRKYAEKIKADLEDVKSLGLMGTPTVFINNMMFQGVYEFTDYDKYIKEEMSK